MMFLINFFNNFFVFRRSKSTNNTVALTHTSMGKNRLFSFSIIFLSDIIRVKVGVNYIVRIEATSLT